MLSTTEFKINQTAIPGLLDIDVTLIEDSRGWFQEKFQKAKLVAAGFPENFNVVQHSLSYNKTVGTTRGLHTEPWDKYVSIISGKIFCAYVDLRLGPTYGQKVEMILDEKKAVFVPAGVANSFQTLTPDVYYTYLVNEHWSAEAVTQYKFVNLADRDLNIQWPISLDKAIISERDQQHPMLKDLAK